MYTVTYHNEVARIIKNEIDTNKENEIAILAMAVITDTIININSILSVLKDGQTDLFAYIEPEKQLKLMKYCANQKTVPVIIHTHLYAEKRVDFSPVDMKFIRAFQSVQNKMKCEVNSLFLVCGANQVALILTIDGKEEKGHIIDTINTKETDHEKVHFKI